MSSYANFCNEVERHISEIFGDSLRKSEAEEEAVISKPFQLTDGGKEDHYDAWRNYGYKIGPVPALRRNNWILLAILSWYLPEVTGWELREYLLTRNKELRVKEMESYLQTKNLMLFNLYKEYDFSHSTIFGNILKPRKSNGDPNRRRKTWYQNTLCIKLISNRRPKPTKANRKRGYHDHGSLPDPAKKGRFEVDNAGLRQIEIELSREQFRSSVLLEIKRRYEEMLRG